MRATINFEADVSRVNDIMRSLVLEESNALQEALMSLERATSDRIVEGISEALEHIHGVARQLQQYQQMMASFEKARFQTMIPQPAQGAPLAVAARSEDGPLAEAIRDTAETSRQMGEFNEFLSRIQSQAAEALVEGTHGESDDVSEEG